MKLSKVGSTPQQTAYARRVWSGKGVNKKQIALDVGYSPSVANSVVSKIESRLGFNNAMAKLAAESGSLALSAMHELQARGFDGFSNSELISSLNAISGAWDKFNKGLVESEKPQDNGKNRLRTVVLQNIERQVNHNGLEEVKVISPVQEAIPAEFVEVKEEPVSEPITNLDF